MNVETLDKILEQIENGILHIQIDLEKGAVYSKHPELGDSSWAKTKPADIESSYRAYYGERGHEDVIPAPLVISTLSEFIAQQAQAKREEAFTSGRAFRTHRDFVLAWKLRWGVEIEDDNTWTMIRAGIKHNISQRNFSAMLKEELASYNQRNKEYSLDRDLIPTVVENWVLDTYQSRLESLCNRIRYDVTAGNVDRVVERLLGIYFIEPSPANVAMFKHLLWSIKRSLFSREIPYRVFFSLQSSAQGIGKTYLLKHLAPALWTYAGCKMLDNLAEDKDVKAMIRRKYLLDFEELAETDTNVARLKEIITTDIASGREMYSAEDAAEKQTAIFVSSTNVHIYDVIQDSEMRRFFEFVCKPPQGFDPQFYLQANDILDNIEALYRMLDENNDYGYFHPSVPEWAEIRAIQASYVSRDAISQFLASKGWEFCESDDPKVIKKEDRNLITVFNAWRTSMADKPWGGRYIKGLIATNHATAPDVDVASKKEYYYFRPTVSQS